MKRHICSIETQEMLQLFNILAPNLIDPQSKYNKIETDETSIILYANFDYCLDIDWSGGELRFEVFSPSSKDTKEIKQQDLIKGLTYLKNIDIDFVEGCQLVPRHFSFLNAEEIRHIAGITNIIKGYEMMDQTHLWKIKCFEKDTSAIFLYNEQAVLEIHFEANNINCISQIGNSCSLEQLQNKQNPIQSISSTNSLFNITILNYLSSIKVYW